MVSAIPLVFHARNCVACGGPLFAVGFFTMAAAPAILCWIATFYIVVRRNVKLHGTFMSMCYGSLFGGFALFRLSLLLAPTEEENFRIFMIAITPLSWITGVIISLFLSKTNIIHIKKS